MGTMNRKMKSAEALVPPQTLNLAAIVANLAVWCRNRDIQLCVLFGSQVTGKAHSRSDVDLAVWTDERPSLAVRLRWLQQLETMLDWGVSLVFISPDLDPVLGFEIVRDGRLVYEVKSGLWADRRAQLWHAYADSLPFRRAQRKQLSQFAEEIRRGT